MIIHISGASGSGKTYLGKKLKKKFGSKIVFKKNSLKIVLLYHSSSIKAQSQMINFIRYGNI